MVEESNLSDVGKVVDATNPPDVSEVVDATNPPDEVMDVTQEEAEVDPLDTSFDVQGRLPARPIDLLERCLFTS